MDDAARQLFADTRQYHEDCAAKFAELCPDGNENNPAWREWVSQLDDWNAAVHSANSPVNDSGSG